MQPERLTAICWDQMLVQAEKTKLRRVNWFLLSFAAQSCSWDFLLVFGSDVASPRPLPHLRGAGAAVRTLRMIHRYGDS